MTIALDFIAEIGNGDSLVVRAKENNARVRIDPATDGAQLAEFLDDHSMMNIHFQPATAMKSWKPADHLGHPKTEFITGAWHTWADFDLPDHLAEKPMSDEAQAWRDAQVAYLKGHATPPSIIMFSGTGVWGIWKLDGFTERAIIHRILCGFKAAMNGMDNAPTSPNNLIRLVGTANKKSGEQAAVLWRGGAIYSPDDLPQADPPPPAADINIGEAIRIDHMDDLDQHGKAGRALDRIKVIAGKLRIPGQPKKGDDSRSAWLFDFCCNAVRLGIPHEVTLGVITDPGWMISEAVLLDDNGKHRNDPDSYAPKQIASAVAHVEEDKPAERETNFAQDVMADIDKPKPEAPPPDITVESFGPFPQPMPPRGWFMEGFICRGQVTIIAGKQGIGKSALSLTVACHLGLSIPLDPWNLMEGGKVGIVNLEEDKLEQQRRLWAITKTMGVEFDSLEGRVHYIDLEDMTLTAYDPDSRLTKPTACLRELRKQITAEELDVVIFDPTVELHEGDAENDNGQMSAFTKLMRKVARDLDIAVVLIAHTRKGSVDPDNPQDSVRGATAFPAAARNVYVLDGMPKDFHATHKLDGHHKQYFRVMSGKINYAANDIDDWFKIVPQQLPNGEWAIGVEAIHLDGIHGALDAERWEHRDRLLGAVRDGHNGEPWKVAAQSKPNLTENLLMILGLRAEEYSAKAVIEAFETAGLIYRDEHRYKNGKNKVACWRVNEDWQRELEGVEK